MSVSSTISTARLLETTPAQALPEQERMPGFQFSIRHSVILKTLIAFFLIIVLNLLSMLAGMYLSESINGDAEAINKAGSLRMQSFRLALAINNAMSSGQGLDAIQGHIEEFDQTIHSSALMQAVRERDGLQAAYQQIQSRWRDLMRPLLDPFPPQRPAFEHEVPYFVESLDGFVHELQLVSERKLVYIRGLQVSTLVITILVALFVILHSYIRLVVPLLAIIAHTKGLGKGSPQQGSAISERITAKNELGLLAKTLDSMALELSELYASLEQQVERKTHALKKSNDSLKLLFTTARNLYKTADDPLPALADLLRPIQQILHSESVSLCLFNLNETDAAKAHTILTTHQREDARCCQTTPQREHPQCCQYPNCPDCPSFDTQPGVSLGQMKSFPLMAEGICLGYLRVSLRDRSLLDETQVQLLTSLADFFAAALNLSALGQKQARIALMEERSVIARELHDSLAQALSYQKIQLTMLKKQLTQGVGQETLLATFDDLQAGLSDAYRQLRELLSTFRLKLDQPGLAASIDATIKEFSRHSPAQIHFDTGIKHCPLTPNEELHSLQIIREALSNVIKHANADNCWISLRQDERGQVHILVEDDGVGIDLSGSRAGHYGLAILKERSQSLGGALDIKTLGSGTSIHVGFMPVYIRPLEAAV